MASPVDPARWLQSLNPHAMRSWCLAIARECEQQEIRPNGVPYLTRYFVAGWAPYKRDHASGAALYLHHFVGSDPQDEVHSHPWAWALSLVLVGGYTEIRCSPSGEATRRTCGPGDLNLLLPSDKHRVELIGPEAWSLLLVGPYAQPWAFSKPCE